MCSSHGQARRVFYAFSIAPRPLSICRHVERKKKEKKGARCASCFVAYHHIYRQEHTKKHTISLSSFIPLCRRPNYKSTPSIKSNRTLFPLASSRIVSACLRATTQWSLRGFFFLFLSRFSIRTSPSCGQNFARSLVFRLGLC